jgi:hypothetical protein
MRPQACVINIVNHNKAAGKPLATLAEAMAQPDQDSWHFGANYSMVCSEFAAHVWKVGLGTALPVWQSILSNEQASRRGGGGGGGGGGCVVASGAV